MKLQWLQFQWRGRKEKKENIKKAFKYSYPDIYQHFWSVHDITLIGFDQVMIAALE